METNNKSERDDQLGYSNHNSGKVLAGLIVVAVGAVLLANKMGAEIPRWVISWEMLLITIGFYVGAKHSFRTWGWMIPVLIGSVFLLDRIVPEFNLRPYFWPMAIITVGLVMIFSPRSLRSRRCRSRGFSNDRISSSGASTRGMNSEDYIDSISVFGGIEKNIVTKSFKGGEITTFFGGSSINMSQADIQDRAVLELTQVFGGAQLIVPANWRLQSEVVSIFGGVEDKRAFQKELPGEASKTLILKGTSVFGGIEIKSF